MRACSAYLAEIVSDKMWKYANVLLLMPSHTRKIVGLYPPGYSEVVASSTARTFKRLLEETFVSLGPPEVVVKCIWTVSPFCTFISKSFLIYNMWLM